MYISFWNLKLYKLNKRNALHLGKWFNSEKLCFGQTDVENLFKYPEVCNIHQYTDNTE